ncbi:hypothetical protein ACFL6R_03790 [Gemmatimonadota bacterium]
MHAGGSSGVSGDLCIQAAMQAEIRHPEGADTIRRQTMYENRAGSASQLLGEPVDQSPVDLERSPASVRSGSVSP